MQRRTGRASVLAGVLAMALLLPAIALGQEGTIQGTVRDADGILPGATVEVRSPALIEGVRSTVTESNGQYRLLALPVGTYEIRISLPNYNVFRRENIILTTGFTATVNAELRPGNVSEEVTVVAEAPTVDVTQARQVTVFTGDELRDLPTARNLSSLMVLVPGITYQTGVINQSGGVCVGGSGVWCTPNVYSFNAHTSALDTDGLAQGRVLVDGMVLNTASTTVAGAVGGYIVDVGNAQEVSFNLSGALGESETGGAAINIVPRTGGNTYRGNYSTSYTSQRWFDRNNRTRTGAQPNLVLHDHDVSGAFGGPILRDRLWFYSVGRTQGKESSQTGGPFYYNLNAGVWGANYQADRSRDPLTYTNVWRNVNTRITLQASPRNKVNVFWDEQDSCQDPCDGTVASYWSPEAMWSVQTYPNRVQQVSWNNPFTNRLLFEGGLNLVTQRYNFTRHRYLDNPQHIPQLLETGTTAGADMTNPGRVAPFAGLPGFDLRSGSIGSSNYNRFGNYRTRLAASYITGAHNAQIGWQGQFYTQIQDVTTNLPQMIYTYSTPAATCRSTEPSEANPFPCGNMSLHFPEDADNTILLRPRPTSVQILAGNRTLDERVWTQALYVQDQWTVNRFTLNGALRYDFAGSRYNPTCVGPNVWVSQERAYCTEAAEGVRFHNITPRWGVAWDVFGDGKTAIKWNMGRYLGAAGFNGVYNGVNIARRTSNSLTRSWNDHNGNRIPDCDWTDPAAHSSLGDTCGAINNLNFARFGRNPLELDELGQSLGLETVYCGQGEVAIVPGAEDYCNRAGQNVFRGWDKRRAEWQFGLGIQRELLPRLSAEVTYNQRWYQNQTTTDNLSVGCNLYSDTTEACQAAMHSYQAAQYDFYRVQAPIDPALPGGGGYWVRGLNSRTTEAALPGSPNVITTHPYVYGWKGVDTNFVLRARGGLRLNGGTSTGKSYRDICSIMNDAPDVRMRDGGPGTPSCNPLSPFQTNVRGSVSYTIPWVDVLASTVFQSRPGPQISANLQYNVADLVWEPASEERATRPCVVAGNNQVGCVYGGAGATTTTTVNLLDWGELYGSRYNQVDLKLAKNIRFARRRVNIGVDVYNLINSDAVVSYNSTYNPQTWSDEHGNEYFQNVWKSAQTLISPRFARFAVQFDF